MDPSWLCFQKHLWVVIRGDPISVLPLGIELPRAKRSSASIMRQPSMYQVRLCACVSMCPDWMSYLFVNVRWNFVRCLIHLNFVLYWNWSSGSWTSGNSVTSSATVGSNEYYNLMKWRKSPSICSFFVSVNSCHGIELVWWVLWSNFLNCIFSFIRKFWSLFAFDVMKWE